MGVCKCIPQTPTVPPSLLNQPPFLSSIMNIDEIQRSLHEARLRCAILEADLDAKMAARMAQEKWALRYRRIIDQLMNGDDNVVMDDDDADDHVRGQETSKDEAPYHPQPPRVDPSLHSTFPAVRHIQTRLV